MDSGYETVMDLSSVIPSVLAIGVHAFMVLAQTSLTLFLMASGAHGLGVRRTAIAFAAMV